jgi:hypothetical protein
MFTRIEYEGETSVYTQISPLKIREERWVHVYTDLSGGKTSIYSFFGVQLSFLFKFNLCAVKLTQKEVHVHLLQFYYAVPCVAFCFSFSFLLSFLYSLSVQRGRIEYEGETSVYTQISPLKIREERWVHVYTDLSGGKTSIYSFFGEDKWVEGKMSM